MKLSLPKAGSRWLWNARDSGIVQYKYGYELWIGDSGLKDLKYFYKCLLNKWILGPKMSGIK